MDADGAAAAGVVESAADGDAAVGAVGGVGAGEQEIAAIARAAEEEVADGVGGGAEGAGAAAGAGVADRWDSQDRIQVDHRRP